MYSDMSVITEYQCCFMCGGSPGINVQGHQYTYSVLSWSRYQHCIIMAVVEMQNKVKITDHFISFILQQLIRDGRLLNIVGIMHTFLLTARYEVYAVSHLLSLCEPNTKVTQFLFLVWLEWYLVHFYLQHTPPDIMFLIILYILWAWGHGMDFGVCVS